MREQIQIHNRVLMKILKTLLCGTVWLHFVCTVAYHMLHSMFISGGSRNFERGFQLHKTPAQFELKIKKKSRHQLFELFLTHRNKLSY